MDGDDFVFDEDIDWAQEAGVEDDDDAPDLQQIRYLEHLREEYKGYEDMIHGGDDAPEFVEDNGANFPINGIHDFEFVVHGMAAFFENQPEAATHLVRALQNNPTELLDELARRAEAEKAKDAEETMRTMERQKNLMTPEARAEFEAAQAYNAAQ